MITLIEEDKRLGKEEALMNRSDDSQESQKKWRDLLVQMLLAIGMFPIHAPSSSALQVRHNHILELYFSIFLQKLEYILHQMHVYKNLFQVEKVYLVYPSGDSEDGNTKNIGSTTSIKELKEGSAIFTKIKNGEKIFSDFWMYYMTGDMAKSHDLEEPPYNNLKTYFEYKGIK